MTLLETLKAQIASESEIAKLKLVVSLSQKRIAELEQGETAVEEEQPAEQEQPAEEAVEEVQEEPVAEEATEEIAEEQPAEEEVPPEEEPVEEPAPAPAPKKAIAKPAPKPALAKPAPKAAPAPRFKVGMKVYGPPKRVNFKTKSYKKGDEVAFDGKLEKIEGQRAIMVYTDPEYKQAMGGNPPMRVWVQLSALEPA